jgi:hypothetical protein
LTESPGKFFVASVPSSLPLAISMTLHAYSGNSFDSESPERVLGSYQDFPFGKGGRG